jgi:hypothetical protein
MKKLLSLNERNDNDSLNDSNNENDNPMYNMKILWPVMASCNQYCRIRVTR